MGLPFDLAHYLGTLCVSEKISGDCLTLGKQDVFMDTDRFFGLLSGLGIVTQSGDGWSVPGSLAARLNAIRTSHLAFGTTPATKGRGLVSDVFFFAGLGFAEIKSVDANPYEGADVIHDLNLRGLESKISTPQDLIVDGGTMEHVFNVPIVLENIFRCLKIGGYVVHFSPTHNWVDHGFYQFSPTLFLDYYCANGWRIVRAHLYRHGNGEPWQFFDYQPTDLRKLSEGGLDHHIYGTAFCAQKLPGSTLDAVPTQGFYRQRWSSI